MAEERKSMSVCIFWKDERKAYTNELTCFVGASDGSAVGTCVGSDVGALVIGAFEGLGIGLGD